MAPVVARALYMMGESVERDWSPAQAAAWEGFLDLAGRLRRRAGDLLKRHGDLSVSMLGIMGRLVPADDQTLRQTALAEAMGLSLSRVSRIIDILERRNLVTRRTCPTDARATNVTLTPAGAAATRAAQNVVYDFVRRNFIDLLSDEEIETLATVFSRLVSAAATTSADS
jgi:DNA-binding MarR family transcriptional regulator